ncbi:alkyl sulfatase dimerization domain-containing protein [Actinomadura terrae]|uniref:alkyl sulfatase dimerization domain-containing protein n=1 Tax=Actinomadura terrae TaxID=604353 RepID=UPI001FA702B4|nr:alkyl sulfatase dimerization domain-containing protein [Actinomadura terrae]
MLPTGTFYQRYLGWFDGNPPHLWEHPPVENATRYVECMGGASRVMALARDYADQGDLRFAATLYDHVVFADPGNTDARTGLAEVYRRLGEGAECGTWRNFYLTGALELREGVRPVPLGIAAGMTAGLSVEQVFDSMAIRVNGPKAWDEHLTIDWAFGDTAERHRMTLSNGVLIHRRVSDGIGGADLTLTLNRPQLFGLVTGKSAEGITSTGDAGALRRLLAVLDGAEPDFPIVTP